MGVAERFAAVLTDRCTIKRRPETTDVATLDSKLGEYSTVTAGVPCLIGQVRVSDDYLAAMPAQRIVWRVLMKPGADLEQHDLLEDDVSGDEWAVIGVPQVCDFRGTNHHIEAVIERRQAV